MAQIPFSFGYDCRGDYAFFLPMNYVRPDGWGLYPEAVPCGPNSTDPVFFRGLDLNNEETSSHGWIEGDQIVQWG
jgi:hypothetical protein